MHSLQTQRKLFTVNAKTKIDANTVDAVHYAWQE